MVLWTPAREFRHYIRQVDYVLPLLAINVRQTFYIGSQQVPSMGLGRVAVLTIILTLAHLVYSTVTIIGFGYTAPLLDLSRSLLPRQSAHRRYRLYRCWRR